MDIEQQLTAQWPQTAIGRPGRVTTDGDHLVWSYNPARQNLAIPPPMEGERVGDRPHWYVPDVRTLESFVRLADASANEIRAFAQDFGVLYICREHRIPSTHRYEPQGRGFGVRQTARGCKIERDDIRRYRQLAERGFLNNCALDCLPPDEYREPLDSWRRYAGNARAILRITQELRGERPGHTEDWAVVYPLVPPERVDLAQRRAIVSLMLDRWLALGGVRPQLLWLETSADIRFGSQTLFGTIAIQLFLTVAGTRAVAICANCKALFDPKRYPRAGQNSYCPACRDAGVPERNASRNSKRRQRARRASK